MAISAINPKVSLRLTDSARKTLCTYSGINPAADESLVTSFASGINTLRKDSVGFKYLVVESELVESV